MLGTVIGNFKLVSLLGSGGMGDVYLAEHVGVQTQVAVKLLRSEISQDAEAIKRLFNEARVVGRIKHAGIVKIFDVGMCEGRAYLVMELLEGESLEQRITHGGPMPAAQVAELGRQIASILDAAHRVGVTHRDLKPENVYLVADEELDGRERIKLLDFGVAKLSGSLTASLGPRTVGLLGTPTYMAPEQWSDSSKVTWACDAYALGCVMFEMACGRPPFVARSIAEACTAHLYDAPPSPRELAPELPAALDEVILRLLSKQPEDRGGSLADIARAIAATMTGAPIAAPAPVERVDSPAPAAMTAPVAITEPVAMTAAVAMTAPGSVPAPATSRTTLGGSSGEIRVPAAQPGSRRVIGMAIGVLIVVAATAVIWIVRDPGTPRARPPAAAVAPVAPRLDPTPAPSQAASAPVVAAGAPAPGPPAAPAPSVDPAPPPPIEPVAPPRDAVSATPTPGKKTASAASQPAEPRTPTGVLSLASVPRCEILVDGKPTGLRTPQHGLKLAAGSHRITLVNAAAGVRDELVVDIVAGQTIRQHKDYRSPLAPSAPPAGPGDDRQTINPFQRKDSP